MINNSENYPIDIFEVKNCIVVPIQTDLYDNFILQLQQLVLERLKNSLTLGIIIDLSAINIIDIFNVKRLINLCEMTRLMGKETVFIGFQPDVAAVLTEFTEVNIDKMMTFINLELALRYLTKNKN